MNCELCSCRTGNVISPYGKSLLENVLPQMVPAISQQSAICEYCIGKLEKIKFFKTKCCKLEQKLEEYLSVHTCHTINLKDFLLAEMENKSLLSPGLHVCRVCLDVVKDTSLSQGFSEESYQGFVKLFIPEMEVSSVTDPVICHSCEVVLEEINKFHQDCLSDYYSSQHIKSSTGHPNISQIEVQIESNRNLVRNIENSLKDTKWKEDNPCYVNSSGEIIGDLDCKEDAGKTFVEKETTIFEKVYVKTEAYSENAPDVGISSDSVSSDVTSHQSNQGGNVIVEGNLIEDMSIKKEMISNENSDISAGNSISSTNCTNNLEGNESFCKQYTWINNSPLFKRNKLNNLFECPCCDYSSKWQQDFKRHFLIQHDKNFKPFQCKICNYQTNRKTELTRHERTEHDESFQPFQCSKCEYKTKWKSSLNRHNKLEHDENATLFKCLQCSYETKQRSALKMHIQVQHDDDREFIECTECNFKTKSKCYLKFHKKSHQKNGEIYECSLCDFTTTWKQYLRKHRKMKHEIHDRDFHCAHCDYKAKVRGCIIQHIKNVHRKPTYHCQNCDYKSRCKRIFDRHVNLKHDRDNLSFICGQCKFKTDRENFLKRHIERRHNKIPVFVNCPNCSYKTKTKQSLEEHIKMIHSTEVELIKCNHCDFETKWKKVLDRHVRLKHDTNCKKFKCPYCKHEAKLKANLKLHIKAKHEKKTVYKCSLCKCQSTSEAYMKRHNRVEHVGVLLKEEMLEIKEEIKTEMCSDHENI